MQSLHDQHGWPETLPAADGPWLWRAHGDIPVVTRGRTLDQPALSTCSFILEIRAAGAAWARLR